MAERTRSREAVALAATVLVLVALVAVAAGIERWTSGAWGGAYRVVVVQDGEALAAFSLDDLTDLGLRRVRMDGEVQEGPALLDVIKAAGVAPFDSVVVTGDGVRDSGRIELRRDQIDRDVVLDIAGRGTTKLCGPRIAYADRVRDVRRVEVR